MSPRTRKNPEAAAAEPSETATPKRRGRPPKAASAPVTEPAAVAPEAGAVTPKRRGRPPKVAGEAVEASETPEKTS